jgi:hypothetical protein
MMPESGDSYTDDALAINLVEGLVGDLSYWLRDYYGLDPTAKLGPEYLKYVSETIDIINFLFNRIPEPTTFGNDEGKFVASPTPS